MYRSDLKSKAVADLGSDPSSFFPILFISDPSFVDSNNMMLRSPLHTINSPWVLRPNLASPPQVVVLNFSLFRFHLIVKSGWRATIHKSSSEPKMGSTLRYKVPSSSAMASCRSESHSNFTVRSSYQK